MPSRFATALLRTIPSSSLAGRIVWALLLATMAGSITPLHATTTFTKVTTGTIVTENFRSFGCVWFDYDDDGDLDLLVTNLGANNSLFRNEGGNVYTKITSGVLVTGGGESFAACVGDYDNDGLPDVFVANFNQQNFLYRNTGAGQFTRISTAPVGTNTGASYGCGWADYNRDGNLDLLVVNGNNQNNFLYQGLGSGTFSRINAGPLALDGSGAHGCSFGDYDGDGDSDVFVATNVAATNRMYRNDDGTGFSLITTGEIATDTGVAIGSSWADVDNDCDLDLLVSNSLNSDNFLYQNTGSGALTRVAGQLNDAGSSMGSAFGDMDNDGDLDLFVANTSNQVNFLYEGHGDGTFSKTTAGAVTSDVGSSRGVVWVDADQDGDLDLYVTNGFGTDDRNFMYINDGNSNAWIVIQCNGTASNRSGVGARIKVRATVAGTPRWQLREIGQQTGGYTHGPLEVHFGLGDATSIDSVIVDWPSGTKDIFVDLGTNQRVTLTEGESDPPVPIFVQGLTAEAEGSDKIRVEWRLAADEAVLGFRLERRDPAGETRTLPEPPALLPADARYFVDTASVSGLYYYSLLVETQNGTTRSPAVEIVISTPGLTLERLFPNPFTPSTSIGFSVPHATRFDISIFDAAGRRVRTLQRGTARAGREVLTWDGLDSHGARVGAGVYSVVLTTKTSRLTRKVVHIR